MITIVLFLCTLLVAHAFPPAPPAVVFGKVRGEFGYSPAEGTTKLLLLADEKVVATATLSEAGRFGENYRMTLPLDLNPSAGVYRAEALTPEDFVSYRFVAERNGVRLPVSKVEMEAGEVVKLEATKLTRIDFVIGEDSDSDGLPDDWERFQASVLGLPDLDPLGLFSADGDQDGDGMSDRDEYVAGTFAGLFEDSFRFRMVRLLEDRSAELQFLAVDGKSYRFEATTDLKSWTPISFTLLEDPVREFGTFLSRSTRMRTIVTAVPAEGEKLIYRLKVD